MQCPKCQSAMTPHTYEGSVVQRCNGCSGLWFEAVDHERLKDLAEVIDIGDPAMGAQYNHIDRINCPNCPNWQMLRMVDSQQPHIWFESCKHCYGRFYDAGEYRDFAKYTLAKFFQDLNVPERN